MKRQGQGQPMRAPGHKPIEPPDRSYRCRACAARPVLPARCSGGCAPAAFARTQPTWDVTSSRHPVATRLRRAACTRPVDACHASVLRGGMRQRFLGSALGSEREFAIRTCQNGKVRTQQEIPVVSHNERSLPKRMFQRIKVPLQCARRRNESLSLLASMFSENT